MPCVGIYARVSTAEQDIDRQLQEAQDYVDQQYSNAQVELYPDLISGTADVRGDEYDRLWTDIADDQLDAVVVHELSRISRLGAGAVHEFLGHALEHDTSVKDLEVGLEIDVDATIVDRAVKQMIAGIMGDLARIEHKQKLRRINSGIKAAQNAGKWTGRAPRGFYVGDEDGRLHANAIEFLETRAALERVLSGESRRSVGDDTGIPESTLRHILDDEERLKMYFYGETEDERKQAALEELAELPELNIADFTEDEVDDRIRQIVREELQATTMDTTTTSG